MSILTSGVTLVDPTVIALYDGTEGNTLSAANAETVPASEEAAITAARATDNVFFASFIIKLLLEFCFCFCVSQIVLVLQSLVC